MSEPSHGGLSFDDCLVKYLGEFGPSQRRTLVLVSVLWIPNSLAVLLMVFANKDPINTLLWQCTNSTDAACQAVYQAANPTADGFCSLSRSSWSWTEPNNSIISQFELICKDSWLAQLVNSAFFLGYLFGSGIFGSLADQHGRRKTLLAASAITALFILLSAFSSNYWMYLASRLLTGVGAAGQSMVTYLLATESIGPSWRGAAGVGTQMVFILGEFTLVLVAYLLQNWHGMCFCITVLAVGSMGVILLVTESPRWLLARGYKPQALAIMEGIAAANGTRMPLEAIADAAPAVDGAHLSLGSILRIRSIRRRFLILAYVWCILCMMYYGISLALGGLKGNMYVTFLISAAAEIPSNLVAIWLIEHIGRHNSLASGMLLGGVACLICSFVSNGAAQAILAAIGKFGCAGAFTVASIYTSELFPTLVRSAVLGAENEAARVGGIAAPFIVLLGQSMHNSALPFVIFGVNAVFAGLMILTLPETLGTAMPDTMADMDQIASIFSTGVYKQGWRAAGSAMLTTRAPSSLTKGGPHPAVGSAALPPAGQGAGSLEAVPEEPSADHVPLLGGGAARMAVNGQHAAEPGVHTGLGHAGAAGGSGAAEGEQSGLLSGMPRS